MSPARRRRPRPSRIKRRNRMTSLWPNAGIRRARKIGRRIDRKMGDTWRDLWED